MPTPPTIPFVVDHKRIASLAHTTYTNTLPPRGGKPGVKSNGRIEYTVLAAFVLSYPSLTGDSHDDYSLISLGTGLGCLPYTSLSVNGDVLHDQHAEVLARRGARLWLLQRLQHEVRSDEIGPRLFEAGNQEGARRWSLRQGVRMHLYISTLPCGDASGRLLEYQRAAQDHVAGTPNTLTPTQLLQLHTRTSSPPQPPSFVIAKDGDNIVRRGRASSSNQPSSTTLRTKPGRPDAPASICMSCSDKLALWNHPSIGLQGSLLSALLEPIGLHSVTICDHPTRHIFPSFPTYPSDSGIETQREELKGVLAADCLRALQRARPHHDPDPIIVGWSTMPFPDSKESKLELAWSAFLTTHTDSPHISESKEFEPVSCPNSVLFVRDPTLESTKGTVENLASGTKMGASTKRVRPGEALKPAARSVLCRLNWFRSFLAGYGPIRGDESMLQTRVLYGDAKEGAFGEGTKLYRVNKAALLGGKEDAEMRVERFLASAREGTAVKAAVEAEQGRKRASTQDTAAVEVAKEDAAKSDFKAWLRTPAVFSRFDIQGRHTGTNHA
ncbi:tRNA-specific adenosine deaminase 1 [Pseudozyma hubeiensis]|nr:tRNA-specific adenosine deaminase 1 [Pseudozyma hubeiensis]